MSVQITDSVLLGKLIHIRDLNKAKFSIIDKKAEDVTEEDTEKFHKKSLALRQKVEALTPLLEEHHRKDCREEATYSYGEVIQTANRLTYKRPSKEL